MIDFIIGGVIYSLIAYFFLFVVFMFTMKPNQTKLQSFFRFLIFILGPITAPFYIMYLIRRN